MTKSDVTKFSKYELNFTLLEKDIGNGWSIFILSMYLVLHRAHVILNIVSLFLPAVFRLMVVCYSYQKATQRQKAQMAK